MKNPGYYNGLYDEIKNASIPDEVLASSAGSFDWQPTASTVCSWVAKLQNWLKKLPEDLLYDFIK